MAIKGTYGPENAKIVLVGDALSKYEYDNGIIINKYTRNLLLDFLEDAGFDSDDVLYVPCFSGSKLSGMKLDGTTLQEDAEEWLFPIIRKHPRRIVIGLGNNAVCALGLVDKPEGINKLRSKWLKSPKLPDIPLAAAIHPKLVSDKPDENGDDFFADLTYAKRIFDGDYEEQAPIHIIDLIEPNMIFDMLPEAKQFKRSRLSYDIETSGLDLSKDLVTTMAFANGIRNASNEWVARFWMGFDKLKPCFEDHVLQQFGESFADFFNEAPNHYDIISGHNVIQFDDPMTEGNLMRSIPGCNEDTRLRKYVVQKYGNHGLKENVTRYLGYSDYDGEVDRQVKILAARRGKVIYELNEIVETEHDSETGNDKYTKKQLIPNPTFEEDIFVIRWAGLEPEFVEDKKRGRKFKWPERLDKKFAAWAMLDAAVVRLYNSYDAVYAWMLGGRLDEDIEEDPRLQMSSYWRHRFAKYLIKATQRGMMTNVTFNREVSELYGKIVENSDLEIKKAVVSIVPSLKDFNPNSQPQLRKVLFGDPIRIPHICARSLKDYWDPKSVEQQLDGFHDAFYRGYQEIKELAAQGAYDLEITTDALKRAFVRYMGSVGRDMTFDIPTRTNRDPSKIYVQIVTKPVYASGLYIPDSKAFTKGGEPSVAAQVLRNLYSERQEKILQLILMRSKAAKLRSTFVDGIYTKLDEFNVLHGEYNTTGARTGRLSSRNPNVQNYPPYLRGQHVARKGMRIVTFDLSQAEIRVVAALSGDEDLMAAMYSEDFHKTTASMVYGIPVEEVDKATRQAMKVVNFGIIYGMGPFKLAVTLNITVEQAEDLLEKYFARFPRLKEWLDNQVVKAQTDYWVETAFGTRISTRNILSGDMKVRSHTERLATNMPVQGTAGELTLMYIDIIIERWEEMYPNNPIFLINTTHDSGSFECEEMLCERLEALITEVIEGELVQVPPLDSVRFKCDIDITDCWYGEPNAMKALDPDFETEKQTLPWHLILGASDDKDEQEELEEINELEEAYYADRAA